MCEIVVDATVGLAKWRGNRMNVTYPVSSVFLRLGKCRISSGGSRLE